MFADEIRPQLGSSLNKKRRVFEFRLAAGRSHHSLFHLGGCPPPPLSTAPSRDGATPDEGTDEDSLGDEGDLRAEGAVLITDSIMIPPGTLTGV